MTKDKSTILIVDDIPTNIELLLDFLGDSGFEVLVAIDGESALEQVEYAPPDLIMLDVMMPGIDGFETCQHLKADLKTQHIPVIFMTALSDTIDKVKGFELGAVDYITKPLQQDEVLARINTHLTMRRLQVELERTNDVLEQRVAERTAKLAESNTLLMEQVAERERTEATLRAIVEGTATVIGRDFLKSLVQHLATTLEVHMAFVTEAIEAINEERTRARILASWDDGRFQEGIEYDLTNTPCQIVMTGETCYYPKNLSRQFLDQSWGMEAYIGVPLKNGVGKILGHIAVLDRRPISTESRHLDLVRIFAARAGAELERKHAEEARAHAYEKLRLTNQAYSRFVPKEFLSLLNHKRITELQLGDQIQMEMTILFADIRSFTSLSEQMTPSENFKFINAYLSRVSPVIRQYNGFIDKYIGDSVMALFPNKADDAIQAAIAMQKVVLNYNDTRLKQGYQPIKIGVGLHTGTLMLGTIGEAERMEGTVISDAVNLASRMEGLTKNYGAGIVMSERVLIQLENSDPYNFRFLDRVQVKGKRKAVSVFELFDGDSPDLLAHKKATKTSFEHALLTYYDQNFAQAQAELQAILNRNPNDKAPQIYLERIDHFNQYGLPDNWNGVVTMTDK